MKRRYPTTEDYTSLPPGRSSFVPSSSSWDPLLDPATHTPSLSMSMASTMTRGGLFLTSEASHQATMRANPIQEQLYGSGMYPHHHAPFNDIPNISPYQYGSPRPREPFMEEMLFQNTPPFSHQGFEGQTILSSTAPFDDIMLQPPTTSSQPNAFYPLPDQWMQLSSAPTQQLHPKSYYPDLTQLPQAPSPAVTTTSMSSCSTATTLPPHQSTPTPIPTDRPYKRLKPTASETTEYQPSSSYPDASDSHLTKQKDLTNYGVPTSDGTWRCAYPGCSSSAVFRRGCDLRKHFKRHSKHLLCRHQGCPQSMQGGFSSKKDRDRHEAKHNPAVPCEWEGCGKMFSRVDNMKDHVKRIHKKR